MKDKSFDLRDYPEDVKKNEEFLKKLDKESLDKLLKEFDEEQKRLWKKD